MFPGVSGGRSIQLSERGVDSILESIEQNPSPLLRNVPRKHTIAQRLAAYAQAAGDEPIEACVSGSRSWCRRAC